MARHPANVIFVHVEQINTNGLHSSNHSKSNMRCQTLKKKKKKKICLSYNNFTAWPIQVRLASPPLDSSSFELTNDTKPRQQSELVIIPSARCVLSVK